ncbi:unnamed protein product [Rotaria magnacalcarata]|uniref:G-protein coupled receptors family 1 profile domain-containing protein n=2 Tax=Rotaria magnacalcarata TaxID=392030 RepID=A0A816PDN7_9BILA|nr:unnamed protein product [Rotaria magnacalcarata]CAF2047254.1 unnamed protein product [Rotaria magnacalcarata]CAF2047259.1 unnamed protein product [Rotaria magnacalcarata]CAF3911598.1 unnamed protein product [Rotaria magnacalcarata]
MFGSLDLLPTGFNLTLDEEDELVKSVVNFLGHRRRDKFAFPLLITLYSFIFATGLTGNLCTCFIIWKSRDMHTPTNFYLFSLAVSDLLLISLGLSVEMYNIYESWPWIFGEAFCVFRTVVLEIVTSASILTVLCFTVERYLAICFPIISQKVLGGLSRALKMIMIVWFLSFLLAVPYTFTAGVFVSVTNEIHNQTVQILDSRICAIRPDYWEPMLYYMAVTTFLVFVIPIFVITVLYILMGITLYKASRRPTSDNRFKTSGTKPEQILLHQNGEHHVWSRQSTVTTIRSRSTRNPRRAVLKMLVAVVIAFFICWAPFHTQRITAFVTRLLDKANKSTISDAATKFQEILFFTSGILYYLSATVNPVLYNIMSKRYRNGFKRTLCRWTVSTPSTSYRNARSNVYKNNNNSSPLSPTLACTNNIRHQRLTYPTKGKKSGQIHKSFFRSRDNVLMFSMSKYKFVIGSRTNTGHTSVPSHPHPRTSLHYRFSLVEQQEREQQQQQQQQQLQIQLQPRKVLLQSYVYIP